MWFRFRLLRWSFILDVPMDARKMMPYWRNFESWLILLIHFIQFLELIFVVKFTLPKTLNNDIYSVFIAFFIEHFLPFSSINIKLCQLYFKNYFKMYLLRITIFIISLLLIVQKIMTVNAYTYSCKITITNI